MSSLENLPILVVDDNKHACRLLSTILRALTFAEVRSCMSPAEAFEILGKWQPGMIITDYQMQPMNGLSFAQELRSNTEYGFLLKPLLLMTGETPNRQLVEEVRASGIDAMVTKPIAPETLLLRMEWAIDHANARLAKSLAVDSAEEAWMVD